MISGTSIINSKISLVVPKYKQIMGMKAYSLFLTFLKDVPKISKVGLLKINKDDLYKYELYENKIPSHLQSVHKIITPMLKAINLLR